MVLAQSDEYVQTSTSLLMANRGAFTHSMASEEKGKLIGVAGGMGNVLQYLKDVGLEIPGWFPLAKWRHLLPGTPQERTEMIDRLGKEISIHRPVVPHP